MKKDFIFLLFFILFLTGCSNPFGLGGSKVSTAYGPATSDSSQPNRSLASQTGVDVISANINHKATVANRDATVSVGSPTSKIVTSSTAGRTIFLSVQGQIFTDQGVEQ